MGPPNVHGEQGVEKGEDMQIPGARGLASTVILDICPPALRGNRPI